MKIWPCRSWKKRTQPVIACCVSSSSSDTGSIRICRLPANGLRTGTRPCAWAWAGLTRGLSALLLHTLLLAALLLPAAAELSALIRHAGTRQAHRRRLADLDRPAHGDRNAARVLGRRFRRLDQLARRAPLAGGPWGRLALAEQVLDVVGIDQDRAGDAHHHQREHQDQADPEMKLQEPVAGRTALRLGSHRDPRLPNKTLAGDGWLRGGTIQRRGRGRSGWSQAPPHRPAPACRRRSLPPISSRRSRGG